MQEHMCVSTRSKQPAANELVCFLGYALPWEREATEITLGLDGGGSSAREQDCAEQIQMGSSGSTFTPINQPLTPGYSPDELGDVNEREERSCFLLRRSHVIRRFKQ